MITLPGEMMSAVVREVRDFWETGAQWRISNDLQGLPKGGYEVDDAPRLAETLLRVRGVEISGFLLDLGLAGRKALEIGCGPGDYSIMMADAGAQVVALDICPTRANSAAVGLRTLGALKEVRGAGVQGSAEQLPFDDAQFDLVFSNGVLHHTPDTPRAFREAHRVLKPGGLFLFSLYHPCSREFLVETLLIQGILQLRLFRYGRNWLGHSTEWTDAPGRRADRSLLRRFLFPRPNHNPVTRVYTLRAVRKLCDGFHSLCRLTPRRLDWLPAYLATR